MHLFEIFIMKNNILVYDLIESLKTVAYVVALLALEDPQCVTRKSGNFISPK